MYVRLEGGNIVNEYEEKLNENKNIILRNIEQGKKAGINKVSAVFAISKRDEIRKNMVTDLATWLITDGYKVSLKEGELEILTIEWD
nr:hypothetical protein [Clostridium chromiireducens]